MPKLRILLKITKIQSGLKKKFKSGLGTVQKFKAVQKIQLRPKYEQIQKWPKKFKKWSKHSTKFQVVQKFNYEENPKILYPILEIGLVNAP